MRQPRSRVRRWPDQPGLALISGASNLIQMGQVEIRKRARTVMVRERDEANTDEADLREVYDTKRHLLYVACTRSPIGC